MRGNLVGFTSSPQIRRAWSFQHFLRKRVGPAFEEVRERMRIE